MTSVKIRAVLAGSQAIVPEPEEARKLYLSGFYGRFVRKEKVKIEEVESLEEPLALSLMEALYLLEKGILSVTTADGREVSAEELMKHAQSLYRNFSILYKVYKDLRDRGYVVRTGLKFGTFYAVYTKGPGLEHAPYLVHVMLPGQKLTSLDIIRAGRLSQTVGKKFVIAFEEGDSVKYLLFSWKTL